MHDYQSPAETDISAAYQHSFLPSSNTKTLFKPFLLPHTSHGSQENLTSVPRGDSGACKANPIPRVSDGCRK